MAVAVARSQFLLLGRRHLHYAGKSSFKPMFAAVALAVSFVFMGVWVRMMSGSFGTFQQVYLRLLLAGLLAALLFRSSFTFVFLRSLRPQDWAIYALRSFFSYTIGVGLFTVAVMHAELSVVSFVSSLPVLGVLGWVFFRERVAPVAWPFIGLSVCGLVLLTGVNLANFRLGFGELMAVVAMLGFDIGYLMSRLHSRDSTNFQNTTILLLIGWIPLLGLSLLLREPQGFGHVTTSGWIGLGMSSILNVAGLYAINYIFIELKAYVAGNILLLEGVIALLVGLLLYGEMPPAGALLGGVIILVCGYAISFIDRNPVSLEAGSEIA